MTIPSTPRKAGPLLGNGVQTSWPFTFKVFADADILVTVADNLGIETPLTLTSDYTVTLNPNQETSPGGTVTYLLPDGYTLVITGDIDYDQPLDLPSGGAFSPTALENELDRLTMQIQQLREAVNRAVQAPITSNASGYLPTPQSNALIGWNESETAMQNFPLSELATAVAFATYRYDTYTGDGTTTSFLLSADPVTLGNIDVSVDGQTYVPGVDHTLVEQNLVFTSAPADGVEILARYGQGLASGASGDAVDIAYHPAGAGAVTTSVDVKLKESVSVKDFGAKGDGSTDDTAAFLAAAATGKPVFVPFGEYVVSGIVLSADACFFADCQFFARLKLKSAANTHVIKTSGDVKLTLHKIGIDGNYVNQTMAPNYPCGVLVPVGSLHMTDCYVFNVMNHAVHTGNTDWDFNAANYAHDITITDNWIVQPTATVGDCIRVHRTKRGVISNNRTQGGLSSIRSNYYCEKLDFVGNICQDNYGDVGVTAALSTDITISGNTCTGNGQHGIEVDGVVRGTVSGNTCSSNVKHGILLTEYGPPSGASYSGSVDGVAISYPTVMSNKDLQVSANTCANNGQSGIHLIGQARVDVKGNTLANNNTSNAGYAGLYIVGGTLNQDDVLVAGNTFTNVGYQTQSILQANVQGQTRTGGNFHTAGTPQWQYAVRGTSRNSLMQDPTLLLSSSVATTPGSIVEDTAARTKYARQINDTNAAGNVTINCLIPAVPLTGDKYIIVRLRTPDTMTKCTLSIQLYLGAGFVTTFASSSITTLSSAWSEYKYRIPDSQKSTPFDNVKVQIDTDVALTGKINIESVECYSTTEL